MCSESESEVVPACLSVPSRPDLGVDGRRSSCVKFCLSVGLLPNWALSRKVLLANLKGCLMGIPYCEEVECGAPSGRSQATYALALTPN